MTDNIPTAPDNVPAKPRGKPWLKIALTASLALNLAFVGWGAAQFYKHKQFARAPLTAAGERIDRMLPEKAARAFREEMDKTRKQLGPISFGEERRALAEALAAEPFDIAKLRDSMTAQRSKMATFQEGLQNSLLAAAEAMTPAERKEYAQKLKHMGKRERDHAGGPPPGPPLGPPLSPPLGPRPGSPPGSN
ncbi:periplasmic heavy metal sensor [Ferrovibrio sp.]|uniref:periplasmic heavy metal sensor n=1 Tax=Ferrovibrio sp. TaxID=1917215 RepID=UPI0025BE5336|nr:periplasmic heavy metal sensor [Ferrovibrio sp.]MBX3456550.1 periplasmic heavy metal sensor [Ferrovibrio sp.]